MKNNILIKRISMFFLIFVVFSTGMFAQVAADPNDTFYEDALRWELQGLVPNLPEMRPYSLQLVKSILETVMSSSDYNAASKAKEYYEKYFDKFLHVGFETRVFTELQNGELEKQLDVNPVFYGNAEVLPNTTISFEITPLISTVKPRNDLIPKYQTPVYDCVSDNLKVSSFNLYTPYNLVAAYGTDEIYVQAGLNRNSFGSILDTGVVIGANAPHVGSIVFTINKEKANYQLGMFMLSASNSDGSGRYPSKYLYLHSLKYSFTEKFDFTIYETAVTGPRFDFTYLIPIVPFMAMQQIVGYSGDNLLIGIELAYKPTSGLNIFLNGYADDIQFNDIVKLKFNTKLKMAIETGVQYAPSNDSLLKLFTFDYTLLAPYMYTHAMYNEKGALDLSVPNYQNYVSSAVSFGSMLSPNSDRIRFNIKIEPMKGLELNILSSVVRHGNINETLYKNGIKNGTVYDAQAFDCVKQYLITDKDVLTDGSIFDFPNTGKGYFRYVNYNFLFLENTTNYVCLQNALDAKYTITFKNKSYLELGVNYTLQYEKNIGVDTNLFIKESTLTESSSTEEIIASANSQYETWKSKLYNEWTNFISFAVKYIY